MKTRPQNLAPASPELLQPFDWESCSAQHFFLSMHTSCVADRLGIFALPSSATLRACCLSAATLALTLCVIATTIHAAETTGPTVQEEQKTKHADDDCAPLAPDEGEDDTDTSDTDTSDTDTSDTDTSDTDTSDTDTSDTDTSDTDTSDTDTSDIQVVEKSDKNSKPDRSQADSKRPGAARTAEAAAQGVLAQEKLDEALALKMDASRMQDLDQVVSLCQEALDLGLAENNAAFAKEVISATRYEQATNLVQPLLQGFPDPNWNARQTKALEYLQQSIDNTPENGELYLLVAEVQQLPGGDTVAGRKAAEQAIQLLKDNPERRSVAYAMRAGYHEDLLERIKDFDRAIAADRTNLDARRDRAQTKLAAGMIDAAIKDFRQILKKDDEDIDALQAIAQAYASQENYQEALKYVDQAIAADEESAQPFILRSRIRLMQEDLSGAITDLDEALDLDPQDLGALLARARLRLANDQSDLAVEDVDRALQLRPNLPQAILLRSIINSASGNFDRAARDLRQLSRSNPDNVEIRMQLAAVYTADKKPRRAIEIFSAILEDDPTSQDARRGRADTLLGVGDHAAAIADYEQSLKVNSEQKSIILKKTEALAEDDPARPVYEGELQGIDAEREGILNNLAWVMVTSPQDELRDGKRGLALAMEACEATDYKQAHILSTLGAAYAEIGDFEKAIEWSTKATELGEGETAAQLRQELESYKQGKPWRELETIEESDDRVSLSSDDLIVQESPPTKQEASTSKKAPKPEKKQEGEEKVSP